MSNLSPIGWALLPLKNYARFSGRAPRAEFWWFFLFTMIIYFVFGFALGGTLGFAAAKMGDAPGRGNFTILAFIGLFWLAIFIPMLALQFRRLHDIGRSGWWLGAFWLLYLVYMGTFFGIASSRTHLGDPGVAAALLFGIFGIGCFIYSIVLLVFFCLPGTRGANRYGDDPYGADVRQVFA